MGYVTCHCKHDKTVHEGGHLSCNLCDCTLYRPVTADDPFKNSVQVHALQLLNFARESQFAKTRHLGARIEGLLSDLANLTEDELRIKAEEERQAKERDRAFRDLERAREAMAEAQAKLEKLGAPIANANKSRKSPTFNPESLVMVACDIPGCTWKDQRRKYGVHKYAAHGIRKEQENA